MLVAADLTAQVDKLLKKRGYRAIGSMPVRGICRIELLGKLGTYLGFVGVMIIPGTIEEAFDRIKEGLIKASEVHGRFPSRVVFQGGGSIAVPAPFARWCREVGIVITVISPADLFAERTDTDL